MFVLLFVLTLALSWLPAAAAGIDEAEILAENFDSVKAWETNFSPYVACDLSCCCYSAELKNLFASCEGGRACQKSHIKVTFSKLRCATCYSMALNDDVDHSVFEQALKKCFSIEAYQVFVAVDSYYNGAVPTQKARTLKSRVLILDIFKPKTTRELHQTGALMSTFPWFERGFPRKHFPLEQTPWLLDWHHGYVALRECITPSDAGKQRFLGRVNVREGSITHDFFLSDGGAYAPKNALERVAKNPVSASYALHHLSRGDLERYAYLWIPALFNSISHAAWHNFVEKGFCYEHKQLATITKDIRAILDMADEQDNATVSRIVVNATWVFFSGLHVVVSKEQWRQSVRVLLELPFMEEYRYICPDNLAPIFDFREQVPQSVLPHRIPQADYYLQHYALDILMKRMQYQEEWCRCAAARLSPVEVVKLRHHVSPLKIATGANHAEILALSKSQNVGWYYFLSARSGFIFRIAGESPLNADFWWHYSMCTPVEKIFLSQSALRVKDKKDPRKAIFVSTHSENATQNNYFLSVYPKCRC